MLMCCAPRYLIIITPVGAGAWQEHWSTVPSLCRLSRDILEVYVVANINWSVLGLMLDAATLEWSRDQGSPKLTSHNIAKMLLDINRHLFPAIPPSCVVID